MWILKGTVFGLVVFVAGFIAYVLYSDFTWHGPPDALVDIRAFINRCVFWVALIGSIVVCCTIFKYLPALLRLAVEDQSKSS
jgi:hypothetical protein